MGFNTAAYKVCDLREVALPLCASILSSIKHFNYLSLLVSFQ